MSEHVNLDGLGERDRRERAARKQIRVPSDARTLPICRSCRGPVDANGIHKPATSDSAESLIRDAADTIEALLSSGCRIGGVSEDEAADARRVLEQLRKRGGA